MSYPPELDTDDIDELAAYIERRYPTEEIRIHDTETIHFGYWDKSTQIVSTMLLDHIQVAGYRILHTGVATLPRRSTRRAWMECRKHDSADEDTTKDMDRDVDRDKNEHNEFMLSCDHCGEEYTPNEAQTTERFGPSKIRYTYPQCGHGTDGLPPIVSKE
jgi:hypothetical protein